MLERQSLGPVANRAAVLRFSGVCTAVPTSLSLEKLNSIASS